MKLTPGERAPFFEGLNENREEISLKDFEDKWLLLYFYPEDDTPGCTTEACSFRDNYNELKKHLNILGVSRDSIESHINFKKKYTLPFSLISDTNQEIIKSYGADGILFPKRVSFLINPLGVIAKTYPNVDPNTHVKEILDDIKKELL